VPQHEYEATAAIDRTRVRFLNPLGAVRRLYLGSALSKCPYRLHWLIAAAVDGVRDPRLPHGSESFRRCIQCYDPCSNSRRDCTADNARPLTQCITTHSLPFTTA
jgi:hypothetical protein